MKEFPYLVYRCPGHHPGRDGGKPYDFKQVTDEDSRLDALFEGYFDTYEEACNPPPKKREQKAEKPDDVGV